MEGPMPTTNELHYIAEQTVERRPGWSLGATIATLSQLAERGSLEDLRTAAYRAAEDIDHAHTPNAIGFDRYWAPPAPPPPEPPPIGHYNRLPECYACGQPRRHNEHPRECRDCGRPWRDANPGGPAVPPNAEFLAARAALKGKPSPMLEPWEDW